ncbi:rootletin-like isoform X2 [Selaginella moellendorffii]|uniref:rootletin-like isoform X2 n=1 Tax=Selaginella moellendorffii TaxID=88036 RepID=UPI000D1C7AAB|nr:rootletin-like isoform X2 [Selaginella moellendorffii]|eukprot:XP_024541461.1 rootletin-like isoform X2 [Selaginella moellendorffii]
MASVAQRYPALIFPSSLFRKPDARCAATGDDGFKAPDRATVSSAASSSPDYKPLDLGPAELKLSLQDEPASKKKEEVRKLEVEGEIGASRTRILEEFRKGLKDKSAGELALYGGIAGVGLAIGGSVLSSLEVLPLVPEALQAVGVGYSILIAGRALKGKNNVLVATSPFKAISELVDSSENSRVQRTTDMDEAVVQALEKLAKERDAAVNKVEEMKQAASDFARLVSEKEALEAVAMELVKERDSAISEVSGLRKAVEAMQGRISSVEKALAQEVQQFRQQNEALEVLACQLATERDSALQEVARLKEMASQSERSEAEKQSLEAVALRLTEERDGALQELEQLKKVVAELRASDSGLTPEQELFIKEKVRAARSQYIDISQGYDKQEKEVQTFVSHLVEEYGAPREWTLNYMKQFLDSKTFVVNENSHTDF